MFEPCYFSVLPARVRYDKSLCANEKIFFSEISSLWNKYGYCFATNGHFANLYNRHPNTISKWISHLKKREYIRVFYTYKEGSKEIDKRLILPGEKAFMPVIDENKMFEDTSTEDFENTFNELSENDIQNLKKNVDVKICTTPKPKDEYPLNRKLKDNNIKFNNNIDRSIYTTFEKKFNKPITPIIKSLLDEWLKIYDKNVLEHAIDIAIKNGVPKLSYMIGILKNWYKSGYKSLEEIHNASTIEIPDLSEEQIEELDEILEWNWFEEEEEGG